MNTAYMRQRISLRELIKKQAGFPPQEKINYSGMIGKIIRDNKNRLIAFEGKKKLQIIDSLERVRNWGGKKETIAKICT